MRTRTPFPNLVTCSVGSSAWPTSNPRFDILRACRSSRSRSFSNFFVHVVTRRRSRWASLHHVAGPVIVFGPGELVGVVRQCGRRVREAENRDGYATAPARSAPTSLVPQSHAERGGGGEAT